MTYLAIFDLDNTLVHSRIDFAAIRRDVTHLLREHGVTEYSVEQFAHLSIGQIIGIGEAFDAAHHSRLGPQAWHIVLEYEREGMRAATVEEDATPALCLLRQQAWKLAILTNNARPATLDALRKFELEPLFDLILTRDEVPMKPAPGGIQYAISRCASTVTKTVMIGDSWLDGKAAQNANIPFVAFGAQTGVLRQREIPLWQTIERLSDLPALLASL